MDLKFDGLLGVVIFLATVAALVVVFLITLAIYVFGRRNAGKTSENIWSKHFLLSALLLLIFDGIFYLLAFFPGRTLKSDEGAALDWWMFYVWIPCHFFGYFIIVFALRFFGRNKVKINEFVDKLR